MFCEFFGYSIFSTGWPGRFRNRVAGDAGLGLERLHLPELF